MKCQTGAVRHYIKIFILPLAMIDVIRTTSENKNFLELVTLLDKELRLEMARSILSSLNLINWIK